MKVAQKMRHGARNTRPHVCFDSPVTLAMGAVMHIVKCTEFEYLISVNCKDSATWGSVPIYPEVYDNGFRKKHIWEMFIT